MRQKYDQISFTVLAGIITVLVPLVLVSCSTAPWQKVSELTRTSPPWYQAYDIDSSEGLTSIASVPMLIRALGDENPQVRVASAEALAAIGPDAKEAVPALIEAVKDDENAVRQAVVDALEAIELKLKVDNDKAETRKTNLLVQTVRLESSDWLVQREAAKQLADMGQDAVSALPALIRVIENQSSPHPLYNEVLQGAVIVLGNIGPEARTANPALIRLMDNKDYEVRLEVVKAMGKIGPASDAAVIAALTRALDGDPELVDIRHVIARGLPSKFEYLAYKAMLHGDPDGDVRREAAASLGKFEAHAVSAVPALLYASLEDIDYNVQRQAIFSLCRVQPGDESAMLALDKAINDKWGPFTRAAAVIELRNAKPELREAWLPRIISCLDDIDEGVRLNSVKTLAAYKIGSDRVYNALNRVALEDKSPKVKNEALRTLLFLKSI